MKLPEERSRDLRRAMCTHNGSTYATECFLCISSAIRAAVLEALDEVVHEWRNAPRSVGVVGIIGRVRQRVSTGGGEK